MYKSVGIVGLIEAVWVIGVSIWFVTSVLIYLIRRK